MRVLWRILGRVLGLFALLQALVIGVLIISHRLRKRRIPEQGFPHLHTPPVQIGATEAQIYTEGTILFNDMLAAIEQAQSSIFLETFILKKDVVGGQFIDALTARARAGVKVYVMLDAVGTTLFGHSPLTEEPSDLPDTFHVLIHYPWRRPWDVIDLHRYALDHRKILVVDNTTGFVGGYNIGTEYRSEWRDTHLRLTGPAARDLGYAFADFWNRNRREQPEIDLPARPWSPVIRVHRNDIVRFSFPIRNVYLEAIEHAQRTIWITNAYFVPDKSLRKALMRAAERGVDVRVLLPWQSNHVVADWLARHFFAECLRSGIRLFGYQGAMIHTKSATMDGIWTTIGTANLDRLSLAGNYEINVEIFDATLAAQMEAIFLHDLTNACEIVLEEWVRRPWYSKFGEGILSPLWPLV